MPTTTFLIFPMGESTLGWEFFVRNLASKNYSPQTAITINKLMQRKIVGEKCRQKAMRDRLFCYNRLLRSNGSSQLKG